MTSTSLNNGVWNDVISNTDKGSNKSPQLQWSAVDVVALKAPVERVKGAFNASNPKFEENFKALDIDEEGNSGNIIAVGRLPGTFSY